MVDTVIVEVGAPAFRPNRGRHLAGGFVAAAFTLLLLAFGAASASA